MESNASCLQAPPPHAQLIQMATAHWVSHILYAAAKLGIADHLADGPKDARALAGPTGTHAPSLHRLMRALANLGVLAEDASHRFALGPLGPALLDGAPGSARAAILTMANPAWIAGFGELLYSVRTGASGYEKSMGMPIFDWLARHPAEAQLFSETMVGFHGQEPAAVAAAYDFSGFDTIVDVGGATGHLLTTILASHPRPRGVLFDLEHVVRDAPPLIEGRGMGGRVAIRSGSFFDAVPAGGDAYLLSHIIHDWSEEQCLAILRHVRSAMNRDGKVLLVEMVLPADDSPHPGKMLDIMMLVGPGGQERTEPEYAALLAKAGLRCVRVVPTASPVSIVEAVAS